MTNTETWIQQGDGSRTIQQRAMRNKDVLNDSETKEQKVCPKKQNQDRSKRLKSRPVTVVLNRRVQLVFIIYQLQQSVDTEKHFKKINYDKRIQVCFVFGQCKLVE